jgi:hypothetical protein
MKAYFIKIGAAAAAGAILGYSYYYFIGCNGSCIIGSNPIISTLYGVIAGVALVFPSKIKGKEEKQSEG